jgi:hypothetical protein
MTATHVTDENIKKFIVDNSILKFASAGDCHGDISRADRFFRACLNEGKLDFISFSGDYQSIETFDKKAAKNAITKVVSIFQNYPNPVMLLGGNYDYLGASGEVATELGKPYFPIGCNIFSSEPYPGNHMKIGRFDVIGVEGTNPINGRFPGEREEREIEWALAEAIKHIPSVNPENTIILTHAPPHGLRDTLGRFGLPRDYWFKHVGSIGLKKFIHKFKPLLVVSGHVHEAIGLTVLEWGKNGSFNKIIDSSIVDTPYNVAVFMKKRQRFTICINHGTIEFWNMFIIQIAEKDDLRIVEISKRKLGGKDYSQGIFDRIMGRKRYYNKYVDPYNLVSEYSHEL